MVTFGHTTYARASCAQIISAVRSLILNIVRNTHASCLTDPVTSVVPTQDHTTYLVMTLDGHIRLMDASSGKLLNDFTGHSHTSYRCRAVFGHGEATVVSGDEAGSVWAWDLLDVGAPR
jgi:WD40 repeat protein